MEYLDFSKGTSILSLALPGDILKHIQKKSQKAASILHSKGFLIWQGKKREREIERERAYKKEEE